MRKILLSLLLGTVCLLGTCITFASDTISSANIIKDTLNGASDCMHYKIIGMCFWMSCSYKGCRVETTFKVDHYLPDAVVSVYTKPDNNPWWFAKAIEDPALYQLGKVQINHLAHFNMGFGNEHDNSSRDMNNKFHEVDIIGNPALVILSRFAFLLSSAATPYKPYYSSLMDAYAWRFPALEQFYPGSLIPGLHEVGQFILHDWGPVYPRNGYVNQPNDAKAAAVNALRASTIITAIRQPHWYMPLSNSCGDHCATYPVKENSKDAQFQMIYPNVESQCTIFGGSDITRLHPWEIGASMKGHHRYIWILWRHYHGCLSDHGAQYLGSVNV